MHERSALPGVPCAQTRPTRRCTALPSGATCLLGAESNDENTHSADRVVVLGAKGSSSRRPPAFSLERCEGEGSQTQTTDNTHSTGMQWAIARSAPYFKWAKWLQSVCNYVYFAKLTVVLRGRTRWRVDPIEVAGGPLRCKVTLKSPLPKRRKSGFKTDSSPGDPRNRLRSHNHTFWD